MLLTAGLACSGCVALWQDDHKVEANTGRAVTIEYDPLLLAPERLTSTAQSECGKFQRVAVLDRVRKGLTWTRIADFRSETEPAYLKGSIASLPPEKPDANLAVAEPSYRSLPFPFPAVPPRMASAPAVPQVAASPADAPKLASLRIIDASGVTRRQIAKPQIAKPQIAKPQIVQPQFAKAQAIGHKVRDLPVASLKRSILS